MQAALQAQATERPPGAAPRPAVVPLLTELCLHVDSGNCARVAAFLAAHPELPLNASGERLVSPLEQACSSAAALPIVRLLLSRGASPHFSVPGLNQTALHAACRGDAGHTVALLLAAGADPLRSDQVGRAPLHWAALHGSPALLRRVLRAMLHRVASVGAACDRAGWLAAEASPAGTLLAATTLVTRDCVTGAPLHEILARISSGTPGGGLVARPPLSLGGGGGPSAFTAAGARAAGAGGEAPRPPFALAPEALRATVAEVFRMVVNAVDLSGYTPIMLAAEHGREEAVRLLLGGGADAMVRNKLSHSASEVRLGQMRAAPRRGETTPALPRWRGPARSSLRTGARCRRSSSPW